MSTPHWTGARLRHPRFDDHYGIDAGGFAEALHVFVDAPRLVQRLERGGLCRVGDLGTGSGRNLLVIWTVFRAVAPPDARLVVETFERDPVPFADALAALERAWEKSSSEVRSRLPGLLDGMRHLRASWPTALPGVSELDTGDSRVRVIARVGDVRTTVPRLAECVHHWCLDGFSPSSNPAMWGHPLLSAIAARTTRDGTASTYTAVERVRCALEAAGFSVSRVTGFDRKRQMLLARHELGGEPELGPLRYPWPAARHPGRVAVVGAGIAGCSVARELAEEGHCVDVFEASTPASGASGNDWALLQPLPNLGGSPVGDWTTRAFVWTRAWARRRGLPWRPVAVARYGDKRAHANRLREELRWGGILQDPTTISDAPTGAILGIATAAMVPPREWCRLLLDHKRIRVHVESPVRVLDDGWTLDGRGPFETVILANSFAARELVSTLELHPVRGQLLYLPATEASAGQRRALCGPVYLLPAEGGRHVLGATYHRDDPTPGLRDEDSQWLWRTLGTAVREGPKPAAPDTAVSGRTSWRGVTPGRLPFVGPLSDAEAVAATLDPYKRGRPQFAPDALRPGLWVTVGHGSRGLVGAPFAAKVLVDALCGRRPPVPADTLDAIHPGRMVVARLRRA